MAVAAWATAGFFTGALFFATFICALAAARFAAHIFFVAAMIAALPAALSFLLGFGVSLLTGGSASPFVFAHLAF